MTGNCIFAHSASCKFSTIFCSIGYSIHLEIGLTAGVINRSTGDAYSSMAPLVFPGARVSLMFTVDYSII
jgi:hypothetical protein